MHSLHISDGVIYVALPDSHIHIFKTTRSAENKANHLRCLEGYNLRKASSF